MEWKDVVTGRRSVRCFLKQCVEDCKIESILSAAVLAPSGKNGQPWKFLVVKRDRQLLQDLAKLTVYQNFVEKADCLIVIFLDKVQSYHYVKDVQAIGACIENMLLETVSQGLGACWIGEILNRDLAVKQRLSLGNILDLMGVLAVGYPGELSRSPQKKTWQDCLLEWR